MEIQEVPLGDEVPEPQGAEEPPTEADEPAQPRKRGRPAGAKNKAKPAPRPAPQPAKPKTKRKAAVVFSDSSDEEEAPRHKRHAPAVQHEALDRRALAADVLDLLQEQRMSRTVAKRNHYAAWFQNM